MRLILTQVAILALVHAVYVWISTAAIAAGRLSKAIDNITRKPVFSSAPRPASSKLDPVYLRNNSIQTRLLYISELTAEIHVGLEMATCGGAQDATLISLISVLHMLDPKTMILSAFPHPMKSRASRTLGEIPPRTQHHRAQAPRWAPTVVELSWQMSLVSGL